MGNRTSRDDQDHAAEPPAEKNLPARFFGRRLRLQSPNEALQPERPPPPPPLRRRRPVLSLASGFLSFLLIMSVAGLFGVLWSAHRLHQPGPLSHDKVVYIARGTDFPDIVAALAAQGVIANPMLFNIAVIAEGKRGKIKAGEYLFKRRASMADVIDLLVTGRQLLHSITIPEGLTSLQVVERLRQDPLLTGPIDEIPKEGSLCPNTYKFTRGMSRAALIKWMQAAQKKLVAKIWARRAPGLILHSPYELVTLASIVEKETGKANERPLVAAVFLNRLARGMKLQSDPTIVYGLVGGKGTLGRPIRRSEIEKPTPYNTYVIKGLPPTPITNPGRAALEAVANPAHTKDLYFVADGTGGHRFSQTLAQHQRNVTHWRKIEKAAEQQQGASATSGASTTAIDKFIPEPPIERRGRHRKHSEREGGSVFGALPNAVDPSGTRIAAPSLGVAAAAVAIARTAPVLPTAIATAPPKSARARHRSALAMTLAWALKTGPGLRPLRINVRGVPDPGAAAALLDGPIDGPAAATNSAGPTPARKPQNSVAGGATLAAGLADGGHAGTEPDGAALPPGGKGSTHHAVFDASQGTPYDPLRNKTFDLNYPKTVPTSTSVP